ncbi:type II toxin-antitoxin system VapC family toxin [Rickettsia bellii]|uniref:PIN domain protein n=1 Tax=Rickettsia bellii str. RML Mogi TaxID=1359194 RepID=A0A0F3QHN2_RICBE|nr:type II toxin-antitoxin system VapC family toxin [Rickettsia bellii]KJV91651.1 PIN domain protein [Rickettsia bellii str. RML Mogi]
MQQKNKSLLKSEHILLDTSAVITLLKKETGYKLIEEIIANSSISSVNLSELVSVLVRTNIPMHEIDKIITDIVPTIIPFSKEIAIEAGKLTSFTKQYGLSLGDRACIATGMYHNMIIYTTDKIWAELKIKDAKLN